MFDQIINILVIVLLIVSISYYIKAHFSSIRLRKHLNSRPKPKFILELNHIKDNEYTIGYVGQPPYKCYKVESNDGSDTYKMCDISKDDMEKITKDRSPVSVGFKYEDFKNIKFKEREEVDKPDDDLTFRLTEAQILYKKFKEKDNDLL